MATIGHVLVATDFGPTAAHALRVAAEISSKFGARLSVIHVVPPPRYPYPVPASEEAISQARGRLEDEAARLGEGVEAVLREGEPAHEIVSAAGAVEADLIVVGSLGRRGVLRALAGSVAEQIVRLSPVPVLVMHPWRFESRAEAARALARRTLHLREAAPAVIALSRDAMVLAAEIGRCFEETPDLLLTTSIVRDGAILGGICEEGTFRIDPEELARAPDSAPRDEAVAATRDRLAAESSEIRASQWIGDVWHRAVVLVADAIDEPWSVLAACEVLRRHGASSLFVAAPVAVWGACAALEGVVDEAIVLHTTDDGIRGASPYRDE